MELIVPWPAAAPSNGLIEAMIKDMSLRFFADGDKPCALTSLPHIGTFVARIVEDERTFNQYVFCWEDQITLSEAWATAERLSEEHFVKKQVSHSVPRPLSLC